MKNTGSTVNEGVGKKLGRGTVKIVDSTVNLAVLALFLLIMAFGVYALWDSNQVYASASSTQYAMYKPVSEADEGLSFGQLRAINPDVFAWLTVYGTNIDYPVTHEEDNELYVNTDVMGNYSLSGSLFLDYNFKGDFSEQNSIIYGHHMDKSAMFGQITDFLNQDFFSQHSYGNLYYAGKNHGVELFAMMEVDAYDSSVYNTSVQEINAQDYLDNLLEKATLTKDIKVTPEDRLVLLSTCTSASTNGRHILVGRITDDTYADPFYIEGEDGGNILSGIDSLHWMDAIKALPWWLWALLGLILSAVLYLVIEKVRKRKHGKNVQN
ncbi:MAG: class B sortase [Oscillospiraceae bacterium]